VIEIARQVVAQVLTVSAVNTQITALNTRFHNSAGWLGDIPTLPTSSDPRNNGVQDMWHKTYRELTRPGVGYMVGVLRAGKAELKASGKNRMTLSLWVECNGQPTDQESAIQQASIIDQAVRYVLEGAESVTLANVSPVAGLVLVSTADIEAINVDAAASGKILGIRSRYDVTVDDARS
jgi:hypothetical protein